MPTIPFLIQKTRTAKGLSQTDLAKICGCTPSTISRMESGTHAPSREAIAALSTALDWTGADLLAIFAPVRAPSVRRPKKALSALLLALCVLSQSCGQTMGRLSGDAPHTVDRVPPSAFPASAPGSAILGDYNLATEAIRLRSTFNEPFTLAHEIRHHADHKSISYADAIRDYTPAHPSPEYASQLAVCWQIDQAGGGWQQIKNCWGAEAVAHTEILAGLK